MRRGTRTALHGLAVLVLLTACSGNDPRSLPKSSFRWNESQIRVGFAHWDEVYRGRTVARGTTVRGLPQGTPLTDVAGDRFEKQLDSYMSHNDVAGIVVLSDGEIRLERYGLGYGASGRWVSQSVAKSVTSTLVGAAVKDGFIRNIDEPVSRYIPGLKGSAYDKVTIRHLMTMTSGVRWDEDYDDPDSDIARFHSGSVTPGLSATVSYMRGLPSEATPGTRWVYKTGETHLLGELVSAATGQTLSEYLSAKIWAPYGMEQDASWSLDRSDHELGGCCLQAALRDYARFGQFVLDRGRIGGTSVVPYDWFREATRAQVSVGRPGRGYGFQWWTNDDGTFQAIGIHGQLLYIDPPRRVVIAVNSAWPNALDMSRSREQARMLEAILRLLDSESNAGG